VAALGGGRRWDGRSWRDAGVIRPGVGEGARACPRAEGQEVERLGKAAGEVVQPRGGSAAAVGGLPTTGSAAWPQAVVHALLGPTVAQRWASGRGGRARELCAGDTNGGRWRRVHGTTTDGVRAREGTTTFIGAASVFPFEAKASQGRRGARTTAGGRGRGVGADGQSRRALR
jgi:hypothetical protein